MIYFSLIVNETNLLIMLKSVPGTKQYWAMRVKFLDHGNIKRLWRSFELMPNRNPLTSIQTCLSLSHATPIKNMIWVNENLAKGFVWLYIKLCCITSCLMNSLLYDSSTRLFSNEAIPQTKNSGVLNMETERNNNSNL